MRVKFEYRTSSRECYNDFCEKHPNIEIPYDKWRTIIYALNEGFRDYILETGEKIKFPNGFGEFTINKRKRKTTKIYKGVEYINLPIDWPKTLEKGKKIYNFNHHTDGFFFGWVWYKRYSMIKHNFAWKFKPSRPTSRILAHYLKTNSENQYKYKEWS